MTQTQDTSADPPRRPRRWAKRLGVGVLMLLSALAAGVFAILDRPMDAPPWVRERVEARLAEQLPALRVDFGRVSVLVQRSGLARIILWDVEIRNLQGGVVAQLSDIEAAIAPGPLLSGEITLREAQVSGAFLTVKRDKDGRLGLALGDAFSEGTEVPDMAQIIAQIDTVAADPRLAALDIFEADALTLRYEDLRARRGWTADGGRLRLTREDGHLRLAGDVALLSGGDDVATVEISAESPLGVSALDVGLVLHDFDSHDIASQSPALSWLDALDASISGSLHAEIDASGQIEETQVTLQLGAGVLQPNPKTKPLPFDEAGVSLRFRPNDGLIRFDDIRVRSALGQVTAKGTAQMEQDSSAGGGALPTALTGQFALSGLSLAQGTVLERPVALSGAEVAFKLTLAPFRVELGELRVTDADHPILASGEFRADPDGWALALDTTLAETNPKQVLAYWPSDLGPGTRRWVSRHVKEGRLHDVAFSLRMRAGAPRPDLFVDFAFEDARVAYSAGLPAISQGRGRMVIEDDRLGLRLDAGRVDMGAAGAVDLSGSTLVIPHLRHEPSVLEARLQTSGPLSAALAYIDNDSWRLLRRQGRDASLATGEAVASGILRIPLIGNLTFDDVVLDLSGQVRDAVSDKAIPGRTLTSDLLDVTVTNDALDISGAVELDAVPAEGRYVLPFGDAPARVDAEVVLTPATLASFGVELPEGMVRGRGTGRLLVDMPDGAAPRFAMETDLAGLGLAVPQIGWDLAPAQTGLFEVTGRLREPVEIGEMRLRGNGLEGVGQLVLGPGNRFDRLELARLQVGSWLDVSGRLRGRGNAMPAVEIASGRVDLRSAPFGTSDTGDGGPGGGSPLALNLGALQVTDSIVLEQFRGDFVTTRGLEGRFDARLAGRARVSGQVIPQPSGSAFRITGEDAGDILRDADMLQTAQDGTFRMDLAPVRGQPGSFDGFLEIQGTRMQKAPAIASLLDAVSIVGLLDQLNGPGVFFSDVEARFRLTPNRVIVSRSSAVGPSMGISLDGYYDLNSGQMDMQGVLSPIYLVNAIGRLVSRQGEGLIGFNFNLRGTVGSPSVAVNPLSVFTPGMFRDIFRRPPPRLSQ